MFSMSISRRRQVRRQGVGEKRPSVLLLAWLCSELCSTLYTLLSNFTLIQLSTWYTGTVYNIFPVGFFVPFRWIFQVSSHLISSHLRLKARINCCRCRPVWYGGGVFGQKSRGWSERKRCCRVGNDHSSSRYTVEWKESSAVEQICQVREKVIFR